MGIKRGVIAVLRATHLVGLANSINNWRFKRKKAAAIKEGKSPIAAVYDHDFFVQNAKLTGSSAPAVAAGIINHCNPKSVIDFGCGGGQYLKELLQRGVDILGVDGSEHAKDHAVIPKESFVIADLTKPFDANRHFDAAICFEVAEHIPTNTSSVLVDTLCKHADIIFFTAAPQGQGGTDHINEQPAEFWIKLFGEKGFVLDDEMTLAVKDEWYEQNVLWWVPKNLMVFKHGKS